MSSSTPPTLSCVPVTEITSFPLSFAPAKGQTPSPSCPHRTSPQNHSRLQRTFIAHTSFVPAQNKPPVLGACTGLAPKAFVPAQDLHTPHILGACTRKLPNLCACTGVRSTILPTCKRTEYMHCLHLPMIFLRIPWPLQSTAPLSSQDPL